jgi:hypothetical protein
MIKKFIKNVAISSMYIFPVYFVFYGAISAIFFNNIFFSIFFVFYGVISVVFVLIVILNFLVKLFKELKK